MRANFHGVGKDKLRMAGDWCLCANRLGEEIATVSSESASRKFIRYRDGRVFVCFQKENRQFVTSDGAMESRKLIF